MEFNKKLFTLFLALGLGNISLFAEREDVLINKNWMLGPNDQIHKEIPRRVNLPHTWNAQDVLSGNRSYFKGLCNYIKKVDIPQEWSSRRVFIRIDGANKILMYRSVMLL